MRLFVINSRQTDKGSVLETSIGLRLVVRDSVPAPSVVDVNFQRFWSYKDRVYALAEVVSCRALSLEEVHDVV